MFLLVPAHPGFPGQIPQSRKTVVCVCVCLCSINNSDWFIFDLSYSRNTRAGAFLDHIVVPSLLLLSV